ncbi:VWA domain-containing protein [Reinekea marina]|uniref:VWA domain-containing protein n=1 Tax=Reinekea marina TaxID=1310421 RepID=A0ABV7WUS7_9GAMM|nr:vWA domain-containing protein [Reinekea marina]MDN3649060.1 VWA domain-containing protein [Reinekea marina]
MLLRFYVSRWVIVFSICLSILAAMLPARAFADVRILLDVSKSMAQNDPENFRLDAISQMIEQLPNGEKAGVWTFGEYVNMLVPHESVDAQWRREAMAAVKRLNAPAIRTNMGGALEKSSYDFNYSTYQGPVHFVLITDGKVDIAPNQEVNRVERTRLIEWVVPKFIEANAVIHTVAISNQADRSLLKQLSDQSGGQHHVLNSGQALTTSLMSVMSDIAPKTQIPMENKGFTVDSGISEVTVLMRHDAGAVSLISPMGDITSAVSPMDQRWRVGAGYSQVTIESPASGRWQVQGDISDNSQISVLSDINIRWINPTASAVAKGTVVSLEAEIVDPSGQRLSAIDPNLMNVEVRANQQVVGSQLDQGVISARLLPRQDQRPLEVEVMLDGGTFKRLIYRQLRYVEPYTSEVLITKDHYEWRIYPNQRLSQFSAISATARAVSNNNSLAGDFIEVDGGYLVWKLPFDATPGEYTATVTGDIESDGSVIMINPQAVTLTVPPSAMGDFLMTPEWVAQQSEMMAENTEEIAPEPIEEMAAETVTVNPDAEWVEEVEPTEESSGLGIMTYMLLSIPGIIVLVGAYFVYRKLESKSSSSDEDDELLMGEEDFADLDSLDVASVDADLDLSVPDAEDDFADAPVMDDIVDSEPELPTPEATEAPTADMEDMLDDIADLQSQADSDTVVEGEEDDDLFDIGSLDDDLADLDLALDGDDPFADSNDDDTKN